MTLIPQLLLIQLKEWKELLDCLILLLLFLMDQFVLLYLWKPLFSLMKENNQITAVEISAILNITLSTAKRKIKDLKTRGLIERIGSDKTGYWNIIGSLEISK